MIELFPFVLFIFLPFLTPSVLLLHLYHYCRYMDNVNNVLGKTHSKHGQNSGYNSSLQINGIIHLQEVQRPKVCLSTKEPIIWE